MNAMTFFYIVKEVDEHKFFTTLARAIKPSRKDPEGSNQDALFECHELECFFEFATSEGLQDQIHFVKPITHLSLALLSQGFSYWAIVWGQCLTGSSYFVTL